MVIRVTAYTTRDSTPEDEPATSARNCLLLSVTVRYLREELEALLGGLGLAGA